MKNFKIICSTSKKGKLIDYLIENDKKQWIFNNKHLKQYCKSEYIKYLESLIEITDETVDISSNKSVLDKKNRVMPDQGECKM